MTTTSSPDTDTSPESPYPGDHETPTSPRRRRWLWGLLIGGGVVFVALVAFVLIVFQPQKLFIDDKVDEALPGLVVAGEAPAAEAPAAELPAPPAAPTVEEPAPVVPPVPTDPFEAALVEAQRIGAPVAVTAGDFVSLEHATSGTAFLVVQPDGSRILRIEDLDTDNGPDLRVVLSTAEVGLGRLREPHRAGSPQGQHRQPELRDPRRPRPVDDPLHGHLVRALQLRLRRGPHRRRLTPWGSLGRMPPRSGGRPGAPARIRTWAHGLGNRCSIP